MRRRESSAQVPSGYREWALKTILLLGKEGQVGWELQRSLAPVGRVIALDRSQLDLTRHDALRTAVREISPDIGVNATGYTTVDKAEAEPARAMAINAVAPLCRLFTV